MRIGQSVGPATESDWLGSQVTGRNVNFSSQKGGMEASGKDETELGRALSKCLGRVCRLTEWAPPPGRSTIGNSMIRELQDVKLSLSS